MNTTPATAASTAATPAAGTLGLGKVVGQATGGFVIGTTSTRLIAACGSCFMR